MHLRSYFIIVLFITLLSTGCVNIPENNSEVDPNEPHPFSLNITFIEFEEKVKETWIWEKELVFPEITSENNSYNIYLSDNSYLELIRFTKDRIYIDYCKLVWTDVNSNTNHEDIINSIFWSIRLFDTENIDFEDSFFLDSMGITNSHILDENFQGNYYSPPYSYNIVRNENENYLELHIDTAATE